MTSGFPGLIARGNEVIEEAPLVALEEPGIGPDHGADRSEDL